MAEPEQTGVQVQVANARPEDVGKGAARVSRKTLQALGMRQGDTLEITGKRHTAAIVLHRHLHRRDRQPRPRPRRLDGRAVLRGSLKQQGATSRQPIGFAIGGS